MNKPRDPRFAHLSDLELVLMQAEIRRAGYSEDKEFLDAILIEIGARHKRALKHAEEKR